MCVLATLPCDTSAFPTICHFCWSHKKRNPICHKCTFSLGNAIKAKRNCRKQKTNSMRQSTLIPGQRNRTTCWQGSIVNCTIRRQALPNFPNLNAFLKRRKRNPQNTLPRTRMKTLHCRMRNSIMNLNSRASGHNCLRFWISALLLLLLLTPASASEAAGQTAPSPAAKNLAIESHFSAAQQAQHDKDYSTAQREYRAVLALAPDFAEVHMNLGLVYQLQDRSDEPMAEFRRGLKLKPGLT